MSTDLNSTRKWLSNQTQEMLNLIRENYAEFVGIPVTDTPTTFKTELELQWVFKQFREEIIEFNRSLK